MERLNALSGVQAWQSQANFILFRVADAQTVFDNLKKQGILIKCIQSSHPLLDNGLRVTVGTPEENQNQMKVSRFAGIGVASAVCQYICHSLPHIEG
ncbi:hypothetical protein PN36_05325 [Candidatus Thiomargarita nelsonii]|uniref:Histidinol-phosphate aminotransferase n=1 Tax=Candidatus Thiomargarita nelsonii TaxID=1003181 RepID=A0A0A6RM86_9GAMM|nr:hypothetical protein PN36_05325 [Candidatus Thiomargarita nelsonii]